MVMFRFSDEERARLLSSDPDPATEERWRQLVDGLPDVSGTFEGHLVGTCDPPCAGDHCGGDWYPWPELN